MASKDHISTRIPAVFAERLERTFPEYDSTEARVYVALKEFFVGRGVLDFPFHPQPPSLYPASPRRPRVQKARVSRPRRARVRRPRRR